MAISLNYHGDVKSEEINVYVPVESEFKVGLNERPPALVQDDDMDAAIRNVTMIGDNIGILRVFIDCVAKKYAVMYSQSGFVHWYVGEGMKKRDHEFGEAREDLGFWEKDDLYVLSEQASDEEDGLNIGFFPNNINFVKIKNINIEMWFWFWVLILWIFVCCFFFSRCNDMLLNVNVLIVQY